MPHFSAATREQIYRDSSKKMLQLHTPAMRRCPRCNKNRTASTQFIASSPLCGECRRPR